MLLHKESRMSQKEAFDAALVALKAQGLEPTEFGLKMREMVLHDEIDSAEAIRRIQEYYKARNRKPIAAH